MKAKTILRTLAKNWKTTLMGISIAGTLALWLFQVIDTKAMLTASSAFTAFNAILTRDGDK